MNRVIGFKAGWIDETGKLIIGRVQVKRVQRSIRVQSRQTNPAGTVEFSKDTAHHGLTVIIDGNGEYRIVEAGSRIETFIHRAIKIEADDAAAGKLVSFRE